MAKNTNKPYEPFTILPPGVCPECHEPMMMLIHTERTGYLMDEDGVVAYDAQRNAIDERFVCMFCGFHTDKYIETDKGFRYSPSGDDEYIIEKNRIPRSPTRVKGNPFIKAFVKGAKGE